MTFNGTNWVTVGTAGFSKGYVDQTSMAISPTGGPYVAFSDDANYNLMTVMKFDGTNWIYVGTAGFSVGTTTYPSLKFNPTGVT